MRTIISLFANRNFQTIGIRLTAAIPPNRLTAIPDIFRIKRPPMGPAAQCFSIPKRGPSTVTIIFPVGRSVVRSWRIGGATYACNVGAAY